MALLCEAGFPMQFCKLIGENLNDHKYTDTGYPLPDFYLQNICKFAVQSTTWSTALVTRATQKDARILTHLFLSGTLERSL